MPHLLIAGTTGSGKSVCINTILLSILMTRTPQEVKLILVDPKMVELQAYKKVPHLCCEVVTNSKKAPGVLQWAVDEMENRYALLSSVNVNHIKSFNRLGETEIAKRLGRDPDPDRVHLSYVVIVIDEFADLMNVASKEVEELIQRLAQKSRAVGMHVIIATQRPSKEVVTGVIKSNLPCQIAFKVNRKIDSRVILDANGGLLNLDAAGGVLLRAGGIGDDGVLGPGSVATVTVRFGATRAGEYRGLVILSAVGVDDAAVLEFSSRGVSRRGVARGEAETERGGGRGGVAEVFADSHRGGTRRRGTRAAPASALRRCARGRLSS